MKKSGCYKITNMINGKYYFGSTKDFEKRVASHLAQLRGNVHHNPHMQNAWNKYSVKHGEDFLRFELIFECDNLLDEEAKLLDGYAGLEDCYNIARAASGGDNLTNHPDRLLIIEKIRNSLLRKYSSKSTVSWRCRNKYGGFEYTKLGKAEV